MNAVSGWANSSDVGIHHPLYRHVVEYFMSADEAKARLESLADSSAENVRHAPHHGRGGERIWV
jgi:hypothetical protein